MASNGGIFATGAENWKKLWQQMVEKLYRVQKSPDWNGKVLARAHWISKIQWNDTEGPISRYILPDLWMPPVSSAIFFIILFLLVLGSNKGDSSIARWMCFLLHAFVFHRRGVLDKYVNILGYIYLIFWGRLQEIQMHVVESPFIWLFNCPICWNLAL